LFFHGAGNASTAASSTIVASTPLQPASIDTAKPLVLLRSTLPIADHVGIDERDEIALIAPACWSTARRRTAAPTGVSSSAEQRGLQHEERDEKTDHGRCDGA
jgi:hypothetical protein